MSRAAYGAIDQIGYLVEDLDEAVARWTERTGIGPWTIFRNVRLDGTYRGEPTTVTMEVALGYQGDLQIELIATPGDTPSPYRDSNGQRLIGIHHIAWIVDNLDDAVADAKRRGLVPVFAARNPASNVAYLESPGEDGILYELIEGAQMRQMISAGIIATKTWDGSNPVTEIDLAVVPA